MTAGADDFRTTGELMLLQMVIQRTKKQGLVESLRRQGIAFRNGRKRIPQCLKQTLQSNWVRYCDRTVEERKGIMAAPPSAYKDRNFIAVIGDEVRVHGTTGIE